jgi:hypothetical protein
MLLGLGMPYTILLVKNEDGVEVRIELMIVYNEVLIKNISILVILQ